jgi:hypothetical protein
MALGKRKHEQQEAWVASTDLPRSQGHPFYRRLNELLAEAGFDACWSRSAALTTPSKRAGPRFRRAPTSA